MKSPPGDLIVEDLRKEYPTPSQPLAVLRGISLRLSPGSQTAIVGPSGSGKSTLLNILAALDRPTAGIVRLGEIAPFALSQNDLARFRAEHVGLVFQDHHLLPQCSALENVFLPRLALAGRMAGGVERAGQWLAEVGLSDRSEHFPWELSGGERQRVAIARALINEPDLLLCDEPTGNLDAASGRAVGDLLHQVAARTGAILIVVTHSAELAQSFASRLRMNDGVLEKCP